MSYDAHLHIDTGDPEGPATVAELGNMTSNVGGMYALALKAAGLPWRVAPASYEGSIANLDGMLAAEAVPFLEAALAHMDAPEHRAAYEALTPSNGWGSYAGARRWLGEILAGCRRHPRATIAISW